MLHGDQTFNHLQEEAGGKKAQVEFFGVTFSLSAIFMQVCLTTFFSLLSQMFASKAQMPSG